MAKRHSSYYKKAEIKKVISSFLGISSFLVLYNFKASFYFAWLK